MPKGILWAVPLEPIKHGVVHLPKPAAHIHCTLQYGVERESFARLLGQTFTAHVWRQSWNDRAEALELSLPWEVPCENLRPHITLATASDGSPVESNTMLASSDNRQVLMLSQKVGMRIAFHDWGEPPASWQSRP